MKRTLDDLLRDAPERVRQAFRNIPIQAQGEVGRAIEQAGYIPPLRKWGIEFGPECAALAEPKLI